MSQGHTTITIQCSVDLLDVDGLIKRLVRQLKADVSLCAPITVQPDCWNRDSFLDPLRLRLRREINRILRSGISETKCIHWQHPAKFERNWLLHAETDPVSGNNNFYVTKVLRLSR